MLEPTALKQVGADTLEIQWNDGHHSIHNARALRLHCPCANCVDEWTRERRIQADSIPPGIKPKSIESVGRYALKISFSDGHDTGIYTFELLRSLDDNKKK